MSENKSIDLINLMVYLTHFHEDTTFNQDFVVCMADRSTADSKPVKFPSSNLPRHKPQGRSDVPEKSRLPRKSILHSDGSTLPVVIRSTTSTVRISSTTKPVERIPDAGRRSKLVPPKVTWHSILSENEKLSTPRDKFTSIPTVGLTTESSEIPQLEEVGKIYMSMSMYLNSDSLRETLMDQVNNLFKPSLPEETTTTTDNKERHRLTDQRKGYTNTDSVDVASENSRPPIISAPYDIERSKVKWIEDYKRKRQTARRKPSSLQPIQEETQETSIDQEFESEERQVRKALEYEEELLRKRIENELPDGLIYDTNMSILVPSSSSSSKESFEIDLVIKAPPIREPIRDYDDAINLSIPEQARSESIKLTEQIEAIKDKYYIYLARKKYKESLKPRRRPDIGRKITTKPASSQGTSSSLHVPIRNPFHDEFVPITLRSPVKASIPLNLMDKHTWGAAALPKPISPHRHYSDSSSDLDILTDQDMNTDGAFEDETMELETLTQRRQEVIDLATIEYVNDFEDPQFTNLTWDESSEQPNFADFHRTENINDLEDPQFSDLSTADSIHQIYEEPHIEPTLPQSPASDPLEDMKRIKEFIMSGRKLKDVDDQPTIDLFMRCSESLINPVVRVELLERQEGTDELIPVIHEIPLSTFTHSKSYETGLLDESILESNLDEPLIKKPSKKIPNYFADLDALHDQRVGEEDEDARYTLIFGLPKFSYEPVPQYLYRKKVHDIMDSEEEPEDSDDILEDDDMNIDSLIKEIEVPTYTFQSEPNYIELSRAREKYYRNLIEKYRALRQSDLQNTTVPESEQLNDPVQVNQSCESTNQEILKRIFAQSYINVNEMVDGISVESILIPYFFDYPIIREVNNCPYHMKIVNIIYRKYEFYFDPSNEEDSPTEMHAKFNQIRNGRICARLKVCPPGLPLLSPRVSDPSQSGSSKIHATTTASGTEPTERPTRNVIRKYLERKVAEDLAAETEEAARRKVVEAEENAKQKISEAVQKIASLNDQIAITEEQIGRIDERPIEDQESEKLAKKVKKIVSWGDEDSTKTSKVSSVTKKFKSHPTKTPASRSASFKTTNVKTSKPVSMRTGAASSGVASSGDGTTDGISSRMTVIMTKTTKRTTGASRNETLSTKRK